MHRSNNSWLLISGTNCNELDGKTPSHPSTMGPAATEAEHRLRKRPAELQHGSVLCRGAAGTTCTHRCQGPRLLRWGLVRRGGGGGRMSEGRSDRGTARLSTRCLSLGCSWAEPWGGARLQHPESIWEKICTSLKLGYPEPEPLSRRAVSRWLCVCRERRSVSTASSGCGWRVQLRRAQGTLPAPPVPWQMLTASTSAWH